MQHVIIKTVFLVPQRNAFGAKIVHGSRDVHKMLEEFTRDVLISGIVFRKFERDGQHVQAIHSHPTRAIRLFEMPAGWKRSGTVKDSNIVEPEKSTLKNVCSVWVFSIHPPGEVQEQFVKNFFQEAAVGNTTDAPLDFVNTPRSPRMYRRIHIAKRPLVSRQLSVGVHIPFSQQ